MHSFYTHSFRNINMVWTHAHHHKVLTKELEDIPRILLRASRLKKFSLQSNEYINDPEMPVADAERATTALVLVQSHSVNPHLASLLHVGTKI